MDEIFRLDITPQTPTSVTQGTYKIFHIPEVCQSRHLVTGDQLDKGMPCPEYESGNIYCGHTLNKAGRDKKNRLLRYNKYKSDLATMAKKNGVRPLAYGMAVYFFIPIPKKWTDQDRRAMHLQPHHRKPDLDNLYKAFMDSLLHDDEIISVVTIGKYWVDTKVGSGASATYGNGYIEVLYGQKVYQLVEFIDQSKISSISKDREYKKRVKMGKLGKRGRPKKA